MEACKKAEIERIVYTSSVATIGKPDTGHIATEENYGNLSEIVGHYKRSKFLAEKLVIECAQQGLPAVIVNPSAPIGPYDIKPTPTGRIIVDFLNGKMPAYLNTGLNFVDVNDVAEGHWLALQHGKPGRCYILGGENLMLREFLQRLAEIVNRPAPKICMPYSIAYLLGGMNSCWSKITKREPLVPLEGVRMAKRIMFFDSARANHELEYQCHPIDQAIKKAINWFNESEYIKLG